MSKIMKYSATLLLATLLSAFAVSLIPNALAQDNEATVIILVSPEEGGTTDPAPGTYTYQDGEVDILTATPTDGYEFVHWEIQGGYINENNIPPLIYPINPNTGEPIDIPLPPRLPAETTYESLVVTQNPLAIVCGYGYTFSYKAVFIPTGPTGRTDAVVVLKDSPGGTTNPGPGTYTFSEGSSITLTATANDDYEFLYWTATQQGDTAHPVVITDNPLAPTCGIGYTYEYQPIFTPAGTTTEGVATEILYAIIIVLAIIAVIAIAAALMYRSKK